MRNGETIILVDQLARDISRSLDVMVFSLEGLFEKYTREQPDMLGLRTFYQASGQMLSDTLRITLGKIDQAHALLNATLSDSERAFTQTLTDSDLYAREAHEAIGAAFQQAQSAYLKRFREIVAARVFHRNAFNPNPTVMTRNGRKWNFTDFLYTVIRWSLVNRHNNNKIGYIVSIDGDAFTLDTTDPVLAAQHYMVADYPELAADMFHPRTDNLVGGLYVST